MIFEFMFAVVQFADDEPIQAWLMAVAIYLLYVLLVGLSDYLVRPSLPRVDNAAA